MHNAYAFGGRIFFAVLTLIFSTAFSSSNLNTCVQHVTICSFVEDLKAKVYTIVEENLDVNTRLGKAIDEVLDLQSLARFVMGQYWNEATSEQKATFSARYGKYIKDVYVSQLKTFSHYKMKIMYVREGDSGEYAVRVRFVNPEQRDDFVVVEFHIVGGSALKISDIRLNSSTSIAISQRTIVQDVIRKYGIDGAVAHFK